MPCIKLRICFNSAGQRFVCNFELIYYYTKLDFKYFEKMMQDFRDPVWSTDYILNRYFESEGSILDIDTMTEKISHMDEYEYTDEEEYETMEDVEVASRDVYHTNELILDYKVILINMSRNGYLLFPKVLPYMNWFTFFVQKSTFSVLSSRVLHFR